MLISLLEFYDIKTFEDEKSMDDSQSTLDDFCAELDEKSESRESRQRKKEGPKESVEEPVTALDEEAIALASEDNEYEYGEDYEDRSIVSTLDIGERKAPDDLPPSYLLSIDYAGDTAKAILKLYDPETERIYFWFDNTGHLPYCYTDYTPQEIHRIRGIVNHHGFVDTKVEDLHDLLRDKERQMTKILARDPLSIGGRSDSIREYLKQNDENHAWEARIRYHNSYTYDTKYVPGLVYKIENGDLVPSPPPLDETTLSGFEETIQEEGLKRIVDEYAPMFFIEVPDIRRLAVDIEVYTPMLNKVPDASQANYPVTAIGMSDNQGKERCFVLRRDRIQQGQKREDYPDDLELVYFENEVEMLIEAFEIIDNYPVVLTFVGDAFDLNYLYHRAKRLRIDMQKYCPIRLGRDIALLDGGIHVDLYRFLKNPSIQSYALSGAYDRNNLETIAQGLLGIGKLELSDEISDLSYYELAHYCWRDANITLRITTYQDDLVMRLIILLMRISRLSIEDLTRYYISTWIQSLFRQEHRTRDCLIPRQDEIEEMKANVAQTEAVIKDKRFKGAIVIEPVAGVHFNATVLDFASLYPSIMKRYNISYETVDCPHEECRKADDNRVPETDHWICKKRPGMISQIIGFFRDARVKWFKTKSRTDDTPEKMRNWYTVVEKALKVFVNAAYGVTGAQHFELFCMPAAESVTAYGRDAIIRTKKKAESMGVRVLYGDTDSVFLDAPNPEQEQELVDWSKEELGIDLEVEKTYKYVALSDRKKNYIGVYHSGRVDVKGLTGKKRNTPDFVQEAFRDMLDILSEVGNPEGFEEAKDEIREIVNNVIDRLEGKAEPYTPEDLAFRVQMTKPIDEYGKTTPQHVRAAMMLRDAGYEVSSGTIIEYIKTKDENGVMPVQLAKDTAYWLDQDKYIDTLRSVFEQVLDSVGLNFEEMLGFTTLDQFF
ncbi:MAG: DNA-directed DNA polymerase I [Promethearchaeati archaeon]